MIVKTIVAVLQTMAFKIDYPVCFLVTVSTKKNHHTTCSCWNCTQPSLVNINVLKDDVKVSQVTALQQTKTCEHTNTHTSVHSAHMLIQRKQRHVHRRAQGHTSSYKDRDAGSFLAPHLTSDKPQVHSAS